MDSLSNMAPGHREGFVLKSFQQCILDKEADLDGIREDIEILQHALLKEDLYDNERRKKEDQIQKLQLELYATAAQLRCLQQGEKQAQADVDFWNIYWT